MTVPRPLHPEERRLAAWMLDLAFPDYDQHNLELRLTHRW